VADCPHAPNERREARPTSSHVGVRPNGDPGPSLCPYYKADAYTAPLEYRTGEVVLPSTFLVGPLDKREA
jgi:hypothetical protein